MTKAVRGKRFHSALVAWWVLTLLGYAGDACLYPTGFSDGARAVGAWLRAQLLTAPAHESALSFPVQLARILPRETYLVPAVAAVVVAVVTHALRRRCSDIVQRGARFGRPARRERGAISIGPVLTSSD